MTLNILTPDKTIFDGEVYGIYLPGIQGYFEILDKHAPIVAALGKGEMKILKEKNGGEEKYSIEGGFIEMNNNKAILLLEGAEKA